MDKLQDFHAEDTRQVECLLWIYKALDLIPSTTPPQPKHNSGRQENEERKPLCLTNRELETDSEIS